MGDRVLVKVDKEEQRSVGGVLLPTAAQSRPTAGSVVAAGDVSMVKVSVFVMTSSCQKLARPVECRQHQQWSQSSRHSDLACNSSTTVQGKVRQTVIWLQLHVLVAQHVHSEVGGIPQQHCCRYPRVSLEHTLCMRQQH